MVAEEPSEKRRQRHRTHKNDREQRPGRVVLFLRKYWFEVLAAVLFALGVFLLVERVKIKASIFGALRWLAKSIVNVVTSILILVAIWMMGYSVRRTRLRRSPNVNSAEPCPKCGGHLGRAHAGRFQRLLALVMRVRIRRYSCRECSFRASVWEEPGA